MPPAASNGHSSSTPANMGRPTADDADDAKLVQCAIYGLSLEAVMLFVVITIIGSMVSVLVGNVIYHLLSDSGKDCRCEQTRSRMEQNSELPQSQYDRDMTVTGK